MRLGSWPTHLIPGTLAQKVYGAKQITERHRHRYEFNLKYKEAMEERGFVICGTSPDSKLVEVVELKDHPWFIACQFHPEFKSKPLEPHPLFAAFIGAALEHKRQRNRTSLAGSIAEPSRAGVGEPQRAAAVRVAPRAGA